MLLTRVAENIYWIGRQIERAECTARLVATHANLSFDTPAGRGLSWDSLLAAGTGEPSGAERADAESVIRTLVTDTESPSSIISSLSSARDNMRSARQRFPREAWEALNRLYFCALDEAPDAGNTAGRYRYLERLVVDSHKLTGILNATMSRDSAYSFYTIGQSC